jgi:predicted DNA-binding transcriptional regulator AlpA
MNVRMMNRKEVCAALGTSSAGLHRGMIDGRFPKPYRTGENSVRWKSSEIQECIDRLQIAEPIPVAPGCKTRGRKPRQSGV